MSSYTMYYMYGPQNIVGVPIDENNRDGTSNIFFLSLGVLNKTIIPLAQYELVIAN